MIAHLALAALYVVGLVALAIAVRTRVAHARAAHERLADFNRRHRGL